MGNSNIPKLTPRLRAAADFVREGAVLADVGTDHAYLPIALCLEGKIARAVATDINDGPIERARINIKKFGLCESIDAFIADGLCGVEEYSPTDIAVLGMGGELIAEIIRRAEWTKREGISLCLQPMTHAEILRAFLLENGYKIKDERLVRDDKIYQIISAEYSGENSAEPYTLAELYFGRHNIERGGKELCDLMHHWESILSVRVRGRESSGEDCAEERELLGQIRRINQKN